MNETDDERASETITADEHRRRVAELDSYTADQTHKRHALARLLRALRDRVSPETARDIDALVETQDTAPPEVTPIAVPEAGLDGDLHHAHVSELIDRASDQVLKRRAIAAKLLEITQGLDPETAASVRQWVAALNCSPAGPNG